MGARAISTGYLRRLEDLVDQMATDRFAPGQTVCSPEYQNGFRQGLALLALGRPATMSFAAGTAQCDAWQSGYQHGLLYEGLMSYWRKSAAEDARTLPAEQRDGAPGVQP